MKQKRVWRYYCDHCGKGGCGKAAMLKHERHCIQNPQRECRMCPHAGLLNMPMPELIAAYVDGGLRLAPLREATDGCPACMLAAIVQARKSDAYDTDGDSEFFDYKAACEAWWKEVNDNRDWPY